MQVGEEQTEERGGEQVAADVAFLQQAGEEAAAFRGEGFEGERCADSPLAAHGDAEEGAEDEKAVEGGGEGGGEFEDREGDDVEDQRRAAAVFFGHRAEEECADRAHGEGPEDGFFDLLAAGVEVGGDGGEAEGEEEEVEGVERPAEEAGGEGVALGWGEGTELAEEGHRPNASICVGLGCIFLI